MHSSKRGFTLIEVMVAITLLALVAAMLTAATRLSIDISSRGNAKAESLRTEKIQRELLRTQLAGALSYHYWVQVDGKRTERVAFEGRPDRILFVSRDGITDGPGSLPRWVEIRPAAGENSQAKLTVEEHRILSPNNQPGEATTAHTDLSCGGVRFEYLDNTDVKPQWRSAWIGTDTPVPLPAAVRIHCRTRDGLTTSLVLLDYADAAEKGMWLQ